MITILFGAIASFLLLIPWKPKQKPVDQLHLLRKRYKARKLTEVENN